MKISNIQIDSFCGIDNMTINAEKVNAFLGKTGSGKTSVLRAIIFALTGEVDVSDIREGASSASVGIIFDDGSSIERERTADGTVVRINGKRSTATAAKEFLTAGLGFDSDFLVPMMGIDFFENASKRDLTDFFTKILPCSIGLEKMIDLIEETQKLSQEAKDWMAKEFPASSYGLEEIDAVYKTAFDARKAKKIEVSTLTAKAKVEGAMKPLESKEEIQEKLFAIAEKEAIAKNAETAWGNYTKSVTARESAEQKLASLKEELSSYASVEKPDEQVLVTAKEDKKKFEDAIVKSRNLKATAEANIKSFADILSALSSNHCVACKDIVCTTDKSCAKADLEERIADNKKTVKEHENFIARCEDQIAKRNAIIDNFASLQVSFAKKEALEKQVREFVLPDVLPKPEAIESGDYSVEKQNLNTKLSLIAQFEVAEKVQKELAVAKKELETLEEVVKALDVKKGVRTKILQRALSTFETLCNKKATDLNSGIEVKFDAEEGIEVKVKTSNSIGFIPMEKISTGQFVLVSYLLMCLIAEIAGGKYLLIDNLDKLDASCVSNFVDLILSDDTFENVFLAGVDHEGTKAACGKTKLVTM